MVVSSKPGNVAAHFTDAKKSHTIADKKLFDGIDNLIEYLEKDKIYEDHYWEPTNPKALKHIDFFVSPDGVAEKWPGQLNYSVEMPDEDIAVLKVKGFEHAPSTVDDSEIFYTTSTSDVNYVLDKLQSGAMQEFMWEQAQDLWSCLKNDFLSNVPAHKLNTEQKKILEPLNLWGDERYSGLNAREKEVLASFDPFACRDMKVDYDTLEKELNSLNLKHNVPLYLKRTSILEQIASKAIPNGGSQNETLAHTVARQYQLEDILSFAIPEDTDELVDLFCVYAGEDRVEENDARNILQWYYDVLRMSVTPDTKEKEMMLIPTVVQDIKTDKGVLKLRDLHNTVDRLRYLDPKNEYALAAHAALEDLESIANAKGADLVKDEDAKDAARAIWANTILYLRDIYHKRSEVDQARPLWDSYDPKSDSHIVDLFQAKAESGEGNETIRYKLCANGAKDLQKTHDDFPCSELATALTFRQVSETSSGAVVKIAKTYERAKEKFMERYPGDKPDIFAISTSKDYSNIIVGDGRHYVSLPVKDIKTAKAIAAILPYYSGAKHVTGAPDLSQYFSN